MNLKKILTGSLAAAMAAACALTFAACGETPEAKLTGDYVSSKNVYTYSNMAPTYNFRTFTVTTAGLKTYDDGTYVYFVHKTTTSNITTGAEVASADYTANSNGYDITYYYGTYTAEAEEGLSTLTLAVPTRVVYSNTGNVMTGAAYYDSANWTDAMGDAYKGKDEETPATAAKFLTDKTKDWTATGEVVIVTTVENGINGQFEIF